MKTRRLAVYTTVYPGVERYLPEWRRSVLAQSDTDFDLWIGLAGLDPGEAMQAAGATIHAEWVCLPADARPAEIRGLAIARMAPRYAGVIFVDSDDVLDTHRVARARAMLADCDVGGCALRIVTEEGCPVGSGIAAPEGVPWDELLPRHNVFGLSNTVYRSAVLRRCLPIPPDCVLVDWLLATRAWAFGAQLAFDQTPCMSYRQRPSSVARTLPPFTEDYVLQAALLVVQHYEFLLTDRPALPEPRREQIRAACERAWEFYDAVDSRPDKLSRYVAALNALPPKPVWWWCVANPELEETWRA